MRGEYADLYERQFLKRKLARNLRRKMQPEEARTQLEARYRTMLILWAALLLPWASISPFSVLVQSPIQRTPRVER